MTDLIGEVLEREGWPEFTDRPDDRGGPTRGGITLKTLSGYLGRPATREELKALDEPTARKIYESVFIERPGFLKIADLGVRSYLIDIGVTSSPLRAIRYLQHILGLKEDGLLGPITANAANAVDGAQLLLKLIARRCVMLAGDTQDHSDQLPNLEGWIARAVAPLDSIVLQPKRTP